MNPTPEEIGRILELLSQGPTHIETATHGIPLARLLQRTEAEPWSVLDMLAHLRACSDVWASSILTMITKEHPSMRYVSPRSYMKKPKYVNPSFEEALKSYTEERQQLIKTLSDLDPTGWARPGIFTGTSARRRHQTVFSYSERIINHEQPHLEQIESLLR